MKKSNYYRKLEIKIKFSYNNYRIKGEFYLKMSTGSIIAIIVAIISILMVVFSIIYIEWSNKRDRKQKEKGLCVRGAQRITGCTRTSALPLWAIHTIKSRIATDG